MESHVFKFGIPVPWSRVLLPIYRKKLDWFTQFGAVGYIITLYSPNRYVKVGGPSEFWGSGPPQLFSGCAHVYNCLLYTSDAADE